MQFAANSRCQSLRSGGMVVNHHPFGRDLRAFLHRNEVFLHLPGGTWMEGGCLTLALALREWMQSGHLMAVFGSAGLTPDTIQHVVLRYGTYYLDGDGVARADELLEKMRLLECLKSPCLVPKLDITEATRNGIPYWKETARELVRMLAQEFGPFDPCLLEGPYLPRPKVAKASAA